MICYIFLNSVALEGVGYLFGVGVLSRSLLTTVDVVGILY